MLTLIEFFLYKVCIYKIYFIAVFVESYNVDI